MARLRALVLATSVVHAVAARVCPRGSFDGVPVACYETGNDTSTQGDDSTGTGSAFLPLVQTMYTQLSLLVPTPKTTSTHAPQPGPGVTCTCVQPAALDGGEYYEGMTPEGRPKPNSATFPGAVQKMVSQASLLVPNETSTPDLPADIVRVMHTKTDGLLEPKKTGTCTTTCVTAFPTFASPRLAPTQTRLDLPAAPHVEITHVPSPHTENSASHLVPDLIPPTGYIETPGPGSDATSQKPTYIIPLTNKVTVLLEHSITSLSGFGSGGYPLPTGSVVKQSQVLHTTTTTTQFIVHSQTLVPGAPATVLEGTTYSLPGPVTITTEHGVVEPTQPAIIYVNGQAIAADKVPGVQTEKKGGKIASYINQGIGGGGSGGSGGGRGDGYATVTESVAYTTLGDVTYFRPTVRVTQTRSDVPSGSGIRSGSTLATSTTGAGTGRGDGYATVTESVAYTTLGGVTYFRPTVRVTQTRSDVPSGSGIRSGSTLATSTTGAGTRTTSDGGASQTTSANPTQTTGNAAGRVTISAACMGAVLFSMAML